MPTMVVATEVEATPEAVEEHLRKYAAALAGTAKPFPFAAGKLIDLKPEAARAVGALPDTKALVIEAFANTPMALIAFVKATGGIQNFMAMASQVVVPEPPKDAAPAEQPDESA
jgi:hypothetical protein